MVLSKKEPKLTSKEIQEYWTPERRASAKPLPLPTIKRKEIPEEELKTKEPVIHSGKKRTKDRLSDVKSYGGALVGSPLDFPYCCCGKLFLTRNGIDYRGSASAIDPHVILTAGHCLYDKEDGGWSDNIAFYPDYHYLSPLLVFASTGDWAIFQEWKDNSTDYPFDMGMIHVTEDMYATTCGYLGWVYNYWAFHPMECIGYPAEPYPYNGYDMYSAAGDTYIAKFYPGMVYMYPNDMGEGVSGAPPGFAQFME